jgi:hypothetical protein
VKTSPIPAVASAVPLLFAASCDPESAPLRDIVVGLGLAVDRSWSVPLPQWLAPIATAIPLGSIDLRAAIALSIPAAIASYLVARRIVASAGRARVLPLAFAVTAAVLLATSPAAALAAIAIELTLSGEELALGAATLIAAWGAPRLFPAVIAALILARPPMRRLAIGALPVAGVLAIPILLRHDSWLSIGNPFVAPSFAAGLFPSAPILRASIVLVLLGLLARMLLRAPSQQERAGPIVALIALATALIRAPGALVLCGVVLAPLAVSFAGALAIAVDRHLARAGRHALALLVPALALGLGARAFEVEASARRLGPSVAAHDFAPLVTHGIAPARAVLLVEDEATLIEFAHARIVAGLRPDLRALPAQVLAAGGAARMTNDTMAALPTAADPLRALLARGVLDPADVAPLAQKTTVLASLPSHRLRSIARHAAPTGGPLILALERVDPSDRRLRRATLERRMSFLSGSLLANDQLRRVLRISATREARVLAAAYDREGALAALARSAALGADPLRVARWVARVHAKQTLENEPPCEDD